MKSRKCLWNEENTKFWQFSMLFSPKNPGHFKYTLCLTLKIICLKNQTKVNQSPPQATSVGSGCFCSWAQDLGSSSNTKAQPSQQMTTASPAQRTDLIDGVGSTGCQARSKGSKQEAGPVERAWSQRKACWSGAHDESCNTSTEMLVRSRIFRHMVQEQSPTCSRWWSYRLQVDVLTSKKIYILGQQNGFMEKSSCHQAWWIQT